MSGMNKRATSRERLLSEHELLRSEIHATHVRAIVMSETAGRNALDELEESERKHVMRIMKTSACAATGAAPATTQPSSTQLNERKRETPEVLRRLRAKLEAENTADEMAQKRLHRAAKDDNRSPRPTTNASRVEKRAAIANAAHSASNVIETHVHEFNASHVNLSADVLGDIECQRSYYLSSSIHASPKRPYGLRREAIAAENRRRAAEAKAKTEAVHQAIIRSKASQRLTTAPSPQPSDTPARQRRSKDEDNRSFEALLQEREQELAQHAAATQAALLERRRAQMVAQLVDEVEFSALRHYADEIDMAARQQQQLEAKRQLEERERLHAQRRQLHASRRALQDELSQVKMEHLQKLHPRDNSVRASGSNSSSVGGASEQERERSPRPATTPAVNRYVDEQWIEDMVRHKEIVAMRKRDAEEEAQRAAALQVQAHLSEEGQGSQQIAAAVEAMQTRRQVAAARRRQEALAAAEERARVKQERLEAAHARADDVESQLLEMRADTIRRRAAEQLELRLRVEEARARELERSAQRRLFDSQFTSVDNSMHYRSFLSNASRIMAGEQPKWLSHLHFLGTMAHVPDAMAHFAHVHSSATFQEEASTLGLLLDAAREEQPPSVAVCATHLVLSAWADHRVFKSVEQKSRATALGVTLGTFAAEAPLKSRGEALRMLLTVADEVRSASRRLADSARASPLGCVLQSLLDDPVEVDGEGGLQTLVAAAQTTSSTKGSVSRRRDRSATALPPPTTRVLPEELAQPPPRSLSDFPTEHAIEMARKTNAARPTVLSAAERLVTLLQEQEELVRAKHLRDGDPVEIRRDRAKAAAEASRRLVAAPSERLTRLSIMQEALRAGIPAQMHAEATSVSASSGETMMSRHLLHEPVRSCSPRLYDERKFAEAKQRAAQRSMIAASEKEEASAALRKPLTPAGHKLINRVYTVPVKRAKDRLANLLKAEEMRFEEATLASKKLELSQQEVAAITARLSARPTSRRRPSPRQPSPTAQRAPSPVLSKTDREELAQRLHAAAIQQQKAESDRLAQTYMPAGRTIKLSPIEQRQSTERLYTGAKSS